jgi:general stress protein 26
MSSDEDMEVSRPLAGAAKLIANVANCWLVTMSRAGRANARPMARVSPDPMLNDWKLLFLADDRSRKIGEIRSANRVEVIIQNDPDEAFATLAGLAKLIVDPTEVEALWRPRYDVHFATLEDRAHATFVEVAVDRMELWIRGVTPEPFGVRPTVIHRETGGRWRLGTALN